MKQKIQITNIGGQALPVIQGILEFRCDENFLLHSRDSAVVAKRIKSFVKEKTSLCLIDDPNDFYEIKQWAKSIEDKFPGSEFTVNVSGGTKIMSLALFDFFRNRPNSRLYQLDQNGIIYFLPDGETGKLTTHLSIEDFISYSGQRVKALTRNEQILDEYFQAKNICKDLYSRNYYDFNELLKQYRALNRKDDSQGDFELINTRTYSKIGWNEKAQCLSLSVKKGRYSNDYSEYQWIGKEYLRIVLETKWFELEVLEVLRHWSLVREMAWGVTMPYREGTDKNEIDVVVNLGNKLLFVECKTQVSDIKDIDKFRNAAKTYGGLGSKAILVTWFEPYERIIEKCNDTNLLHFQFVNPDKSLNNKQSLLDYLDTEINKLNTF